MKPIGRWTLEECISLCEEQEDCEGCPLKTICVKGIDSWVLPSGFSGGEISALKVLLKLGIRYMARDPAGVLIWFEEPPIKQYGGWLAPGECGTLPQNRFRSIQWSDEAPLDIAKVLENL